MSLKEKLNKNFKNDTIIKLRDVEDNIETILEKSRLVDNLVVAEKNTQKAIVRLEKLQLVDESSLIIHKGITCEELLTLIQDKKKSLEIIGKQIIVEKELLKNLRKLYTNITKVFISNSKVYNYKHTTFYIKHDEDMTYYVIHDSKDNIIIKDILILHDKDKDLHMEKKVKHVFGKMMSELNTEKNLRNMSRTLDTMIKGWNTPRMPRLSSFIPAPMPEIFNPFSKNIITGI